MTNGFLSIFFPDIRSDLPFVLTGYGQKKAQELIKQGCVDEILQRWDKSCDNLTNLLSHTNESKNEKKYMNKSIALIFN
jgi:hypothetical protein